MAFRLKLSMRLLRGLRFCMDKKNDLLGRMRLKGKCGRVS